MDETTVLIEQLQKGDKEARKVLIEKNLGLVHHIVKRFLGRGVEAEDLFQIGTIGLMKAIDKFDLSYQVKFSTYAVPLISGEIKRFLRDDGMVKVSRSLKENGWKINRVMEQKKLECGADITIQELVKETGLTQEEIVMAMEANVHVESIYKSVYHSDGCEIYLVDQMVAENREDVLDHVLLEELLESLGDAERKLLKLRYFENMTQVQVARILGMSQVQVSRTEKKILQGLREKYVG